MVGCILEPDEVGHRDRAGGRAVRMSAFEAEGSVEGADYIWPGSGSGRRCR